MKLFTIAVGIMAAAPLFGQEPSARMLQGQPLIELRTNYVPIKKFLLKTGIGLPVDVQEVTIDQFLVKGALSPEDLDRLKLAVQNLSLTVRNNVPPDKVLTFETTQGAMIQGTFNQIWQAYIQPYFNLIQQRIHELT